MTFKDENLRQPDQISGDEYKIMVRIAQYAHNHEPLNEYFDPVRTKAAYDRESHSWDPQDKFHFSKVFPEAVTKQKEAFSEVFNIIEDFLTENPDADLKLLDKAYVEMAVLYGFNTDLNQAYIRFRNYYHESREFMRKLEAKFPDKMDLVEFLTTKRPEKPTDFKIKRGPFAFEIRVTQEMLNKFDSKKINQTFYEKLKEKIVPSINLGGINSEVTDYQTDITANFIMYPLDQTLVDFFRGFNDFVRQGRINKFLTELNLKPQTSRFSKESVKTHENQHALYNLILSAEKTYNPKNIVAEVEAILKESDPSKVREEDFSNFCYFLVKNAFYENASHEILARIKDGNFISSIGVINDPESYNYANTYMVSIDLLDNLFVEETLKKFLENKDQLMATRFQHIYKAYSEQARRYIYNVTIVIAQFLQKHPDKNTKLTNMLMFKPLENWVDEINKYSGYLIKNK